MIEKRIEKEVRYELKKIDWLSRRSISFLSCLSIAPVVLACFPKVLWYFTGSIAEAMELGALRIGL